jgi:hypothetical protein
LKTPIKANSLESSFDLSTSISTTKSIPESQKLAVHGGFLNLHHPSSHVFHKIFESEAFGRMPNGECCVYLPDEDMDTFKLFLEWTVKEHLGNGPDMPTSPKIWELDSAEAVRMLRFADYWRIHSLRKEMLSYVG